MNWIHCLQKSKYKGLKAGGMKDLLLITGGGRDEKEEGTGMGQALLHDNDTSNDYFKSTVLTRKMHTFSTIKNIPANLGHFITPNLGMSKSGFFRPPE